jgi:hypothetical protein
MNDELLSMNQATSFIHHSTFIVHHLLQPPILEVKLAIAD